MSVALWFVTSVLTPIPAAAETLAAAVQQSDLIVLAHCIDASSRWSDDGRFIVTDVQLAVERSFKGDAPAAVMVRTLGGRVGGDVAMGAAHAATLQPNTPVVAFLRRSAHGSYFVITSVSSGVLPVATDQGPPVVRAGATTMSLDALAARITAESP